MGTSMRRCLLDKATFCHFPISVRQASIAIRGDFNHRLKALSTSNFHTSCIFTWQFNQLHRQLARLTLFYTKTAE